MTPSFIRILRTPYSERFLVQVKPGVDCGALELHYLVDGHVAGTLILFEEANIADDMVADLLKDIDDILLPEVSIEDKNLFFTVVTGRVVGTFIPEAHEE